MKLFTHFALRLLLGILTGTSTKQRIIILGVRRSGNHALTSWLTNAQDEGPSELIPQGPKPPLSHCHKSPSGTVVLLNEINELDFRSTLNLFLKARKWTKRCQLLMVSLEDVRPSEYFNFRRLKGTEIWIRRSPLEIISSRYHNINKKANQGIGWSRQSCDEYFIQTLMEYNTGGPDRGLTWNYNAWLESSAWRKAFLKKINLTCDEMPGHSAIGGGSSFHGTSGKVESDMQQRLTRVSPAAPWKSFLSDLATAAPSLFNPEETEAIRFFLDEQTPKKTE